MARADKGKGGGGRKGEGVPAAQRHPVATSARASVRADVRVRVRVTVSRQQ